MLNELLTFAWRWTNPEVAENKFIFKVKTLVQGIILINRSFAKQII
tara:strand:- start:102 stop:239 length:138 start_codon:yes stop_codon:yes gene_type:complete